MLIKAMSPPEGVLALAGGVPFPTSPPSRTSLLMPAHGDPDQSSSHSRLTAAWLSHLLCIPPRSHSWTPSGGALPGTAINVHVACHSGPYKEAAMETSRLNSPIKAVCHSEADEPTTRGILFHHPPTHVQVRAGHTPRDTSLFPHLRIQYCCWKSHNPTA